MMMTMQWHCNVVSGLKEKFHPHPVVLGDSPNGDSAFSGGTFDDIGVPEEMVLSILVTFSKLL